MKAIVLLCLLHAALVQTEEKYSWRGPDDQQKKDAAPDIKKRDCLSHQAACGCCLMQEWLKKTEVMLNNSLEALNMELSVAKTTLDNMRGKQGIFSVALSKKTTLNCYGPFDDDDVIIFYSHTFINIGDSYEASTGIFTVPCSGVYSLAISLYGHHSPGVNSTTCANLQVNGKTMSSLPKTRGLEDKEDSSTVVMAVRLEAGDELAVSLPKGCVVCDKSGHMTAFTGYLLYATD